MKRFLHDLLLSLHNKQGSDLFTKFAVFQSLFKCPNGANKSFLSKTQILCIFIFASRSIKFHLTFFSFSLPFYSIGMIFAFQKIMFDQNEIYTQREGQCVLCSKLGLYLSIFILLGMPNSAF